MSNEIRFVWNGKEYSVKPEVAGKKHIVLPNRKVLKPTVWWCGFGGPSIMHLEEVKHHLEHAPVGEIAEHVGDAIFAHEAD